MTDLDLEAIKPEEGAVYTAPEPIEEVVPKELTNGHKFGSDWTRPVWNPEKKEYEQKSLQPRQRAFIMDYLLNMNGPRAALKAGFKESSCSQYAAELLSRPFIREIIDRELKKRHMGPDQIKASLQTMATADVTTILEDIPLWQRDPKTGDLVLDPDGNKIPLISRVDGKQATEKTINWEKVRELGPRVKSIEFTPSGPKIALYDSQHALELLGKNQKLFSEEIDLKQSGEVIVKVVRGVKLEDLK